MFGLLKDKNFYKVIIIVLLAMVLYFFVLSYMRFFAISKLKVIDIYSQISYRLKSRPTEINQIVIIPIDDASFKALNKKWPWERNMFALLLEKLKEYEPKVIALDFALVGESKNPKDDLALSEAFKKSGNVIIASYFDPQGKYVIPYKLFLDTALGYGIINKPRDNDFYVRRARAVVFSRRNKSVIDYSFEIKTLASYLEVQQNHISYDGKNIVLNKGNKDFTKIPIRKDGSIPIKYLVRQNDFKHIPYWEILKKDLSKEILKDKIVLIGLTSEIFHDIYHTPLGVMPGVVINANEILMFLTGNFVKSIHRSLDLLVLIFFVLVISTITYRFSAFTGLVSTILGIALFFALGLILFLNNYWTDYFSAGFLMIMSYLGISIYKYIRLFVESQALKTQAITDGLTGLFIHRYFRILLQNELDRALRYNPPLSFIIMDIDHFKHINDTYGHEQGNIVLKHIAQILKSISRKVDLIARYGGEEFCVILPHTTQEGAVNYAEKVRKQIQDFNFPIAGKSLKITVSLGVVTFPNLKVEKIEELIEAADRALYEAKNTGRNKVCVFK